MHSFMTVLLLALSFMLLYRSHSFICCFFSLIRSRFSFLIHSCLPFHLPIPVTRLYLSRSLCCLLHAPCSSFRYFLSLYIFFSIVLPSFPPPAILLCLSHLLGLLYSYTFSRTFIDSPHPIVDPSTVASTGLFFLPLNSYKYFPCIDPSLQFPAFLSAFLLSHHKLPLIAYLLTSQAISLLTTELSYSKDFRGIFLEEAFRGLLNGRTCLAWTAIFDQSVFPSRFPRPVLPFPEARCKICTINHCHKHTFKFTSGHDAHIHTRTHTPAHPNHTHARTHKHTLSVVISHARGGSQTQTNYMS